jgi:uncharacterized Zn-binding protein involved in type VI secretion
VREAGRFGDESRVPADKHGCPECAHVATGPAVTGSPNVMINNQLALRVGDRGVHSKCCGANSWVAYEGAPCVLINDRHQHRLGDDDKHCGGMGKLIQGSPDVLVGDWAGPPKQKSRELHVALLDFSGKFIPNIDYIVEGPITLSGKTAEQPIVHEDLPPGHYKVRFPAMNLVLPYGAPRGDQK